MKFNYLFIFLLLSVFSCTKKTETKCFENDPLLEVDWLKEKKFYFENDMSQMKQHIIMYKYKNEYVFDVNNCVTCEDNLTQIYDCEENVICEFGGIGGVKTCPDFYKKSELIEVLFE